MPQPLSQVPGVTTFGFGTDTISAFPDLANLVLKTISAYSVADARLAEILAVLLKSEARAVVAMYTQITSSDVKKGMLKAAAAAILEPVPLSILNAVLDALDAPRNRRNDFAHHLWGWSEQLPETLLLIHPKAFTRARAAMIETKATQKPYTDANMMDRKLIVVYRRADLIESAEAAAHAAHITNSLYHLLGSELYEQLPTHFPQLQKLLDQRALQGLSSGSARAGSPPPQK
jgi:hypothetical protein